MVEYLNKNLQKFFKIENLDFFPYNTVLIFNLIYGLIIIEFKLTTASIRQHEFSKLDNI